MDFWRVRLFCLRAGSPLTLTATPIFRDRGLAALRRTDDGSLFLDKGLIPGKAKGVRVRVKHGNRVVGCSKVCRPPEGAESIESRILQARDTVFEEELFYEMMREARVLGNQGVTTRQNLVEVPVSGEQELLLDLVDWDQDHDPEVAASGEQDVFADAVAHSIRILLAYAHRQNLRRRTQPPPALTPKRRPVPEYHILRPIMAYLQHKSHLEWLKSFMDDLRDVLESAGIKCEFHATQFSSIGTLQPSIQVPKVEALARVFLAPFESTFSGKLVDTQSSFQVRLRTSPVIPPLGTFYDISFSHPPFPDVLSPGRVGLQDEVSSMVTHYCMLDIVAAISQKSDKQEHGAGEISWEALFPHHGQLRDPTDERRKMIVSLSREELSIKGHFLALGEGYGNRPPKMSETWKPEPGESKPNLAEFVSQASQLSSW